MQFANERGEKCLYSDYETKLIYPSNIHETARIQNT